MNTWIGTISIIVVVIISKVLSQHLRGTLKMVFGRHLVIEDFTVMDQYPC